MCVLYIYRSCSWAFYLSTSFLLSILLLSFNREGESISSLPSQLFPLIASPFSICCLFFFLLTLSFFLIELVDLCSYTNRVKDWSSRIASLATIVHKGSVRKTKEGERSRKVTWSWCKSTTKYGGLSMNFYENKAPGEGGKGKATTEGRPKLAESGFPSFDQVNTNFLFLFAFSWILALTWSSSRSRPSLSYISAVLSSRCWVLMNWRAARLNPRMVCIRSREDDKF